VSRLVTKTGLYANRAREAAKGRECVLDRATRVGEGPVPYMGNLAGERWDTPSVTGGIADCVVLWPLRCPPGSKPATFAKYGPGCGSNSNCNWQRNNSGASIECC